MRWVLNKWTWIIAVTVFLMTSLIETINENTPNDFVDFIYFLSAFGAWIYLSIFLTYTLKIEWTYNKYNDSSIAPNLIGKPILLILCSIMAFLVMTYMMIID